MVKKLIHLMTNALALPILPPCVPKQPPDCHGILGTGSGEAAVAERPAGETRAPVEAETGGGGGSDSVGRFACERA